MEYRYLLDFAIILVATKVMGLWFERIKLPQVSGALIAGIIIGPACLNLVTKTDLISQVSEFGVILLMFLAGLGTDIEEMKKVGVASTVIATIGVVVPLIGGFGLFYFFNQPGVLASDASAPVLLQNIFIGVVLTATSVSITVETLKELGKLNSRAGNAILGAAIIDDILGILVLTAITSLSDSSVSIVTVIIKILLFFVFVAIFGSMYHIFFKKYTEHIRENRHRYVIFCMAFAFFMAYASEEFFGVADITGAFFAGIMLSGMKKTEYVSKRSEIVSYSFLSPVFFASIGLNITISGLSGTLVIFTILYTIIALLTKIVGCFLGAKLCKFSNQESLEIGIGMISRGEVALIVAQKGLTEGLLSSVVMAPVVIMVVVSTVITPILLKMAFSKELKPQA